MDNATKYNYLEPQFRHADANDDNNRSSVHIGGVVMQINKKYQEDKTNRIRRGDHDSTMGTLFPNTVTED